MNENQFQSEKSSKKNLSKPNGVKTQKGQSDNVYHLSIDQISVEISKEKQLSSFKGQNNTTTYISINQNISTVETEELKDVGKVADVPSDDYVKLSSDNDLDNSGSSVVDQPGKLPEAQKGLNDPQNLSEDIQT